MGYKVTEKNINNIKQDKIKYLVQDFKECGVSEETTRGILLKRGINKWLANRLAIINLKDELLQDIRDYLSLMQIVAMVEGKYSLKYKEVLGSLKATNTIRQKIRKICHSKRWIINRRI